MPPTGPMSVQPRGLRMARGSPLLPRLSSNTQKASGALVPTINRTSFSLILGNSMSLRWGPFFVSCSEGILRREAFSLSTVHSLLTQPCQYHQVTLRLGWSWPTLGLSSLSWVVRKNVFSCPRTPSSLASVLSHKEISEPLSRSAYVSTTLSASRLRTFTGTTLRQTFPPPVEVLLVCPLDNGVPLLTWVPCSTTLVLFSTDCCEGGGWSKVWCRLLQPWTSHVLLAKHPTAMWPHLKQLWHNWAFLITCSRSSSLFSTKSCISLRDELHCIPGRLHIS